MKVHLVSSVPTYTVEQWRSEVAKYDWPVDNVLKTMQGESGGNPSKLNNNPNTGDYSVGLMQINLFGKLAKARPSEEWLKVPENNIAYAYQMYASSKSFCPWTAARKIGVATNCR